MLKVGDLVKVVGESSYTRRRMIPVPSIGTITEISKDHVYPIAVRIPSIREKEFVFSPNELEKIELTVLVRRKPCSK